MKYENGLFWVGLVSLFLSLFLFPCVAYLFPAVWLGWTYHMPDFILNQVLWMEASFQLTYPLALLWFFRLIFILAVLFGGVAYFIAHRISQQHMAIEDTSEVALAAKQSAQSHKENVRFFLKMVVILTLVFIISDVIQWAISASSPSAGPS